jgi:hypothetical protein
MKTKKHTVIRGNSLHLLTITEKYLGEINLDSATNRSEKLMRLKAMEDKNSGIFLGSDDQMILAVCIEGIKFNASARAIGGDLFQPILKDRGSSTDAGTPVYEFQIRPPAKRNMWAFGQYRMGTLREITMGISLNLANSDKLELRRPPIPNCHSSSGTICLGNALTKDDKEFNVAKFPNVIQKLINGGWNADWYQNQAKFVEKNGIMINRWVTPISHMSECRIIANADMTSIVNLLENDGGKQKLPIVTTNETRNPTTVNRTANPTPTTIAN